MHLELPGSERALLRASTVVIDQQISRLSKSLSIEEYRAATEALLASWAGLVQLLALGQAAELRECPSCRHFGMRAATRCGYCWAELSPLPSAPDGATTPAQSSPST